MQPFTHVEDNPNTAVDSLFHLCNDSNDQVATLLTCALHMAGGSFSKLSSKRRKKLNKCVKDPQLACWLEDTEEMLSYFQMMCPELWRLCMLIRPMGLSHLPTEPWQSVNLPSAAQQGRVSFPSVAEDLSPTITSSPFVGGCCDQSRFSGHLISIPHMANITSPPSMGLTWHAQSNQPVTDSLQPPLMAPSKVNSHLFFPLTNGRVSGLHRQFERILGAFS